MKIIYHKKSRQKTTLRVNFLINFFNYSYHYYEEFIKIDQQLCELSCKLRVKQNG